MLNYFLSRKAIPKILPEEHPSADSAVDIALRCCTRCLRLLHSCRLIGDNSGKRHEPEKTIFNYLLEFSLDLEIPFTMKKAG